MKKILLSLMMVGLVATAGYGATKAFFTDTEKSIGNTFTAGTIDISVDGQNPWNKIYPMLLDKPSQTNYINFEIANVGENPANVWKRLNNVVTDDGDDSFCGASSEPEYVEGGGQFDANGVCTGSYVERNDLDSYMIYDMYVCPGGLQEPSCAVNTDGKPTGGGWTVIIPEANQVRVDNVNGIWIKLNGELQRDGKLAVSQSYHLTAWDDAGEPMVTNWAQGDTMSFDIEVEARQLTAPAPGSTQLASVNLVEKNTTTWNVVPGGASGTLSYNTAGETFNYSFTASGLDLNVEYSLIYYADPWPGNHPGALIASGNSGPGGNLVLSGNVELGMDLPNPSDGNYPVGAKIWLVPSAAYNSGSHSLTSWNAGKYLFEMNPIKYDDTGI